MIGCEQSPGALNFPVAAGAQSGKIGDNREWRRRGTRRHLRM